MRKIFVEFLQNKPVGQRRVNIAERKGIGHPDTLMDSLCNNASNALSRYYLKNFKAILHHNVDKGLLIAGQARPKFGGGKIIKPMEIYIAGRATSKVGKKKINIDSIIRKEAIVYLSNFKQLGKNYKLYVKVKEGALNLKEVFKKKAIANDTSFGVAHAPLSHTERLALNVCNFLNYELPRRIRAIGPDVKVMAAKMDNKLKLALAIAFIGRYVSSMGEYVKIKEEIRKEVINFVGFPCEVEINTLDNTNGDENSIYLTVTGFSAENGDDGQVGRGNRPSGLITPDRPMSLEATSGKNINHPGKLYQVLSQLMANRIAKINGVSECYVKILTQIGKPLNEPLVSIEIVGKEDNTVAKEAEDIANDILSSMESIQKDIAKNKLMLF